MIINACAEVTESGRLRYLMHLILKVGNAVNTRSTAKLFRGNNSAGDVSSVSADVLGGAVESPAGKEVTCFSLSALENLSKTRSNSGDTVEEYICYKLLLHLPQALDLAADLASIEGAKEVNIARLMHDSEVLTASIGMLTKLLETEEQSRAKSKEADSALDLSAQHIKKHLELMKRLSASIATEVRTMRLQSLTRRTQSNLLTFLFPSLLPFL